MGYPTYGTFSFDDNTNYIAERINGDRSSVDRTLIVGDISRREGSRVLADEYSNKIISIEGRIVDTTVSGFNGAVDNMKKMLRLTEQNLQFVSDRYYTANLQRLNISQDNDEITIAKYTAEFLITDPFAKGSQQTVTLTVTSGTTSRTDTITISGTVYTRPTITYTAPNGLITARTTTSGIIISHVPTGTTLTWSGTANTRPLTYSGTVAFNYNNLSILNTGVEEDFSGFFPTWDVGSNQFTTTFSGGSQGGTLVISYVPKYL